MTATTGVRLCTVTGCERPHYGRGMCNRHYQRWRNGTYDPATGVDTTVGRAMTPEERYAKYVREGDGDECWEWLGHHDPAGYGMVTGETGVMTQAHRWVYRYHGGTTVAHAPLDHRCRNKGCVNPAHLEPVTIRENTNRGPSGALGREMRQTCKRGHDMTDPANVYQRPGGGQMCRPCAQMRKRGEA